MTVSRLGAGDTAIEPTIIDAKGDLIVGAAADTPSRFAAGNNGESLVADSGATNGLRWQINQSAGKNKIINGDFAINQRNFTSNTGTGTYNFDRFYQINGGSSGTLTVTPQTFTAGTAPASGYESTNFLRAVTASGANANTFALIEQKIEDVRTFAGQTITVSFWAKAGSGTPSISVEVEQNFGSGGSSPVYTAAPAKTTISTSWVRYSATINVPSISGKTIGTGSATIIGFWLSGGSDFNTRANSIGLQNATFDLWGIQAESGSVATAFQTATGTIQGELAACQRYYIRYTGDNNDLLSPTGIQSSATAAAIPLPVPVVMRTDPTVIEYANVRLLDTQGAQTITALVIGTDTTNEIVSLGVTTSGGGTATRPVFIGANANAAYIGIGAEL
jgi:hypothetical protein